MPHLYLQLQEQLRQWLKPKDKRHLQGFAEAVAAILQSGRASLSHWLPYLSHRECQARSQMERLSYFVHNPHIIAERFYNPLVKHFLQAFAGESLELALDTSMLWDKFCLIELMLRRSLKRFQGLPFQVRLLQSLNIQFGFESKMIEFRIEFENL